MKLVCTVGAGRKPYEVTTYHFGAVEKCTNLAPIAIGCCAVAKDLELVALLTDKAEAMYGAQLRTEAEDEGWSYASVRIPEGKSEKELWEIFEAFGRELEQGDEIVLDLTHGFRHIPALLLSATQYYAIRKNLNLFGIFYGAYEARENGKTPIFDLTPLYDLSEWAYGVRLLRDYQLSAPLGDMLDEIHTRSHTDPRYQHDRFTRLKNIGESLKNLDSPLVSGIPLEAGFEAQNVLDKMRSGEKELARIAPMKEPRRELKEQLDSYSLQKPSVPKEGKPKEEKPKEEKPKKKVSLTLEELERQSQLIEGYLGSGNLSASAILLREWMISTVIFHSGNTKDWLNRDTRLELAERKLGALSRWTEDESLKEALTAQQKELVGLWQGVSERRNDLAHAGMNEDMTKFQPAPFRRAFDKLRTKLGDASFWSVETADKTDDVWLISPLGTTPGALFTAIKRAESDQLLIVTSEQGKRLAPEVLREAEREDLSPHFALLDDPFNGFSEVRGLTGSLRKEHGLDWIRAGEIVVNLTGGTTCLGWAVAQLENNLKRMSLNPRTVACIDRRTPEEQKRNPYREGEMQDIEPDEEKGNE